MALWRSDLSQKRPLPVPACGHRTATPQDCDQAARALRPYTNTRAKKERVEVQSEALGRPRTGAPWQCCCARAGFPLHLCTKYFTHSFTKVTEEGSQTNKLLQGPLQHPESTPAHLHSLWVTSNWWILKQKWDEGHFLWTVLLQLRTAKNKLSKKVSAYNDLHYKCNEISRRKWVAQRDPFISFFRESLSSWFLML